jgi:hypothetical protein
MQLRVLFMGVLLLAGTSGACNSTTVPPDCPSTTIILDAGIDGLADVGEYMSSELCEALCGPGLMVCCRVHEQVLKCQPGCS